MMTKMTSIGRYLLTSGLVMSFFFALNVRAAEIVEFNAEGLGLGTADFDFLDLPLGGCGVDACVAGGKSFANNDYIDLIMTLEDSGETETVAFRERIVNNTGVDWHDFHIELGFVAIDTTSSGSPTYDIISIPSVLEFTAFAVLDDVFSDVSLMPGDRPFEVWLDEGIVAAGDSFDIVFNLNIPDFDSTTMPLEASPRGGGVGLPSRWGIGLRQSPSLQVSDIPEPGTFALLGVGLIGLGYLRRKEKKVKCRG